MKSLALKSFMWVLYAKQPLRTKELQDALATYKGFKSRQNLELDDVDTILEACANLLMQEHDIIRPIHFSVQEFLTKSPLQALQGFCLENIQVPAFVHSQNSCSYLYLLSRK
jgi:hypothetical protein